MFKPVEAKPDFPEIEKKIFQFWEKNNILSKYLSKNKDSEKRFSFLDGPITANNPMGVHHAWGRSLKDFYQRFKNMQGFCERFQNGFDNQGLWVEVEVEKKLGFKTKKDIEKFGIANFVKECKKHTQHFAKVQTDQSQRLGYFMDWGNDYYTMSDQNNYAIWHFLKKVWQDGNLYKGRDSVPWCPRCGTAISQHEILTEEYQELTHDSIYFGLPIIAGKKRGQTSSGERFLVWTTTPWTIPGNVALAVHPELEYVQVRSETGLKFWLVGSLVKKIFGRNVEVLEKVLGEKLVGLKYQGPFDELEAVQAAKKENPKTWHSVVASKDLVNEEEGTGIVHIATGCGTEDFRLGEKESLPVLPVIDETACYLEGFGDLSGKNAKENPEFVLDHPLLKVKFGKIAEDYILKIEPYLHRYPVCWRCKTELVWRVVDEWYIAMDETRHPKAQNYRHRLLRIIKDICWIPSFGYDRELDWLKNMEDWLISKKRYWGLALPIWECECGNFEVIGSWEELKKRASEGWEEFEGNTPHRPWVDAVKIKCSKCGQKISRIPDVGNPWLDAGIVPFSTLNYFEDKTYWRKWFPADLVLECFPGQFKNWFYSMLAMSAVLEDKAPFKTLLGHALVRDEDGEEMHKSKGNAIEFNEAAEKMGADVMRWMFLLQNAALNVNFGFSVADEIKKRFLFILWNCYKFFVTYAELDGFDPVDDLRLKKGEEKFTYKSFDHTILDVWILSKLNKLVKEATQYLEEYETNQAARLIEKFVIEDLSTWYIRRIRNRVGPTAASGEDKKVAHITLYSVLLILSKLLAPFMPFLAEEIYQNLINPQRGFKDLESAVQGSRESVHLTDWPQFHDYLVNEEVLEKMEKARKIVEKGHAVRKQSGIKLKQPLARMWISGEKKFSGEVLEIIKEELNIKEIILEKPLGVGDVELDKEITPALKAEGQLRELIREIQDLRKKAGFGLEDKINTFWQTESKQLENVITFYNDQIKAGTLTVELTGEKPEQVDTSGSITIDDQTIWLAVRKI